MPQLIYRCLYALSLLLTPLLLFHRKIRIGFLGRIGLSRRLSSLKLNRANPYWFHFASSGEFEQALPIAESLKTKLPSVKILFTFFSPSGKRAVDLETERRKIAGKPIPWDYADYLPLDLPFTVRKSLKLINPKALILINRELWPELIYQCHKAQIPSYLFCSFFPEGQKLNSFFHGSVLNRLTKIGTVGATTTEKLLNQFPNLKIESIGDTRPQRVWERRQLQKTSPSWTAFFENRRVFLAASIWPEDFESLKPSLLFIKNHPKSRILLVPHEIHDTFIEDIRGWGKAQGLGFRRWSQFLQAPDDESPLIVDSIGLLAELYQISQIAFVGGSFKKRIHNVLEPAAYGNAILTGPYMNNSFEATEMNEKGLGLKSTQNSGEFLERLQLLISDKNYLHMQQKLSRRYILDRQGSSMGYTNLLVN